jgi:hypothetical protein
VIYGDIFALSVFEGQVFVHRVVAHFLFNREIHPAERAGEPVIACAKSEQSA